MDQQLSSVIEKLEAGDVHGAAALAREYLKSNPVLGEISLSSRLKTAELQTDLTRVRLYMVRSYTLEPLIPFLKAWGLANSALLDVEVGQFGQHWQEVLDSGSRLYDDAVDVILVGLRAEDLVQGIGFGALADDGKGASIADELYGQIQSMLQRIRSRSKAKIVVQGFDIPRFCAGGLLAFQKPNGLPWLIRQANARIAGLCESIADMVYLDMETMVANVGPQWYSESAWFTSRNPMSGLGLREYARNVVRAILALLGRTRKCIVLDLDNTLWGGVVGDDGPRGIAIGHSYPGNNFLAFQQWLKEMERLGFLLAINSKNDEALVQEVLANHPDMVLRPGDFAAIVANWSDKATNIAEIAARLNLSSDSFVFVDDNPVEIDLVRQAHSEVACYRMDENPLEVVRAMMADGGLDKLAVTEEDRKRTSMYLAQEKRAKLEASANTLEDFLASLEMRAVVGQVGPGTVERVSQLTQKTNQFNLTTRRYSPGEIEAMAKDPSRDVLWLELTDKFGSNGIVGVAILRIQGQECVIDNLLLSCRVMGRTVEDAFMGHIAEMAHRRGASVLVGEYRPTKRNGVVQGLYSKLGFERVSCTTQGWSTWRLKLPAKLGSPFVRVEAHRGGEYPKEVLTL